MKKTVLSFLVICIAITTIQAQNKPVNPFEEFGYKPKIATLSKGKYVEFHDQDTIVQIGGAIFNTVTMKIMGFVEDDTVRNEYTLAPEVISRWLSPDPLTSEYPSWSPYNYAADNPIFYTDPDGRAVRPVNKEASQVLETTFASFNGNTKTFTDALLIAPNSQGVITSNYISPSGQPLDFRGFKKHLKNEGITLNNTQLIEAFNVYSLIKTDQVYELAVFQKPTSGTTTEPGESGTTFTNEISKSKNQNYFNFLDQFQQDPEAIDSKTNEEGYGIIPFETIDPTNSNSSIGERGTIIIDATDNDVNQASDKFKDASKEIPQ